MQKQIGAALDDVLKQKPEAIYIGPDNLTQANAATIVTAARENHIPVFTGDSGIVRGGAAAAVGINYFEVGRINGRQAARILGGARASTLEPAVAKESYLYLNTAVLTNLGIVVRPELTGFLTRRTWPR
jgi:putative ABC transport system substrate-binding protein